MRTSIVIHQRDVLCVVRHIWLHDGLKDLVNVPLCIHVAIDKHQICLTPDTYTTFLCAKHNSDPTYTN